jgi:hypothetical protein
MVGAISGANLAWMRSPAMRRFSGEIRCDILRRSELDHRVQLAGRRSAATPPPRA